MITVERQSEFLVNGLSAILEPIGFKFQNKSVPNSFVLNGKGMRIELKLNLRRRIKTSFVSNFIISIDQIENHILKLDSLPSYADLKLFRRGEMFLTTFGEYKKVNENYSWLNVIEKEVDLIKWVEYEKNYLINEGMTFIENISTLSSFYDMINHKIDDIDSILKMWTGGLEVYFKYLILMKLNSDQLFEEKLELITREFESSEISADWKTTFNQFSSILDSIKPLPKEELNRKMIEIDLKPNL